MVEGGSCASGGLVSEIDDACAEGAVVSQGGLGPMVVSQRGLGLGRPLMVRRVWKRGFKDCNLKAKAKIWP